MSETPKSRDFLRQIIDKHIEEDTYSGKVITRFPPEPNGYLHIGHAKSICINFGLAKEYQGVCHLRMDDTDPTKESYEYVNSIQEDVKWLGFDWQDKLFFASDYFQKLYEYAIFLIKKGRAYVCSLNEEEIRAYRGTVTEPGKHSPYRERSIEENLDLFERMKNGEFENGKHVLRAKADMSSPNMKMRDPLLYRIRHAHHYRAEDNWCIYPMYDFAHCLSDSLEGITHSICTLEFENNRELYDWILDACEVKEPRPHQYEFARLSLNYTVMSKRKLLELVEKKYVNGWDDPRMPTISGLRRRGVTPEALKNFCEIIGIAKANSVVDISQLEFCIRDDLNPKVPRVLAVLNPLKVTIENFPEGKTEILDASYYPHDVPLEGSRQVPFTREIFIEREDFMENPPKGYYRLSPGKEVRLRHGYIIKCEKVIKDKEGKITELVCSYDPATKSGSDTSGKKVSGTIHWVSATKSKKVEVRLYDRLFTKEMPENIDDGFNKDSLITLNNCYIEEALTNAVPGSRFQFERQGYFYYDTIEAEKGNIVFNRIVTLKDSWTKAKQPVKEPVKKQEIKKTTEPQDDKNKFELSEMQPDVKERFIKLTQQIGLGNEEALTIAKQADLIEFYENAISVYNNPKGMASWVSNELVREIKDKPVNELPFGPEKFAELIKLIDKEIISGKIAKDVLVYMLKGEGSPKEIVDKYELKQISSEKELNVYIDDVIKNNPKNVELYKSGKDKLFGFFVGQVMKNTKGRANPELINKLIKEKLK